MANPILSRVVDKIAVLQGTEFDEVDKSYWQELAVFIIQEFLKQDDLVVDKVAKAIYLEKTEDIGGDWDNVDPARKERIWKESARYVLNSLRDAVVLDEG
jgi:hypothetical protein